MKKLLSLLAVLLLCGTALADPLPLGDELCGVACWPDGTDEATASYVYRYSYPTAAGDDDVSLMINEFYTYTVEDALTFTVPINGESLADEEGPCSTTITSTVTCNNDDFFSVLMVKESRFGDIVYTIYSAHTFGRIGAKAGSVVSLPYLLGLLENEATDEWLETRQTAKADECVRRMIWEIIEEQMDDGTVAYYDDLDYETLTELFYPEEDYYLDADGDPVFFLEEGMAADRSEGVLLFPFTLEELLDEI